jgi:hypothetical protein
MEQWNTGIMGLKEFFAMIMFYFHLYSQYSNIPSFRGGGINQEFLNIL